MFFGTFTFPKKIKQNPLEADLCIFFSNGWGKPPPGK